MQAFTPLHGQFAIYVSHDCRKQMQCCFRII